MGYNTDEDTDFDVPTISDEDELLQSDESSIIVITDDENDAGLDNESTNARRRQAEPANERPHDDSPYALLLKHKEFFNQLQRTRPDIYDDLWTVHDLVVESVRRRPCILHPTPGLSGHPCLGKAKIPFHRPLRNGYVTITDRQKLTDQEAQTSTNPTTQARTQTDDKRQRTTGTQTDHSLNHKTTQTNTMRTKDHETTATHTTQRSSDRGQDPMDPRPTTRAQPDRSVKMEDVLGWRRIGDEWVNVQPPLPGCWLCGVADGHRMSECQAGAKGGTICFRCGLRGVTVKTCPVHGKSWRRLGPYHRPTERPTARKGMDPSSPGTGRSDDAQRPR